MNLFESVNADYPRQIVIHKSATERISLSEITLIEEIGSFTRFTDVKGAESVVKTGLILSIAVAY